MNRRTVLVLYQLLTGISDTSTGLLLIFLPALTLRMMGLQAATESLPFLSYVGVFVLSVGLACLYGARLASLGTRQKLEVVWLLTAITRGLVAVFVVWKMLSGVLKPEWASVALSDAAIACLQMLGLSLGWLAYALD